MATLSLIHAPDPRLKVRSEPVERVDDELRAFMDDMLAVMYAAPGVGLSAVQVGVARRVIVIDAAREDGPAAPLYLINPEITWFSDEGIVFNEGCLSLPEQFAEIERPERIRLDYVDRQGEARNLEAGGLLSRCIQHEYDHLDGVLFVDRLSMVKRNMILRKLVKARRQAVSA